SRSSQPHQQQKTPTLSEDVMMKTTLLTTLVLALSYHYVAALYPGTPKECCYAYRTGKALQYTLFESYYWTDRDCFLNAVVFLKKPRVKICLNPEEPWVKKAMKKIMRNRQE
ncbi:hypothetical protein lerEdw1_001013, partial [Lerista edwardsae]